MTRLVSVLSLVCLVSPTMAQALSCIEPSIKRSFSQFQSVEDRYVVVRGTLVGVRPKDTDAHPVQQSYVARLTGHSLSYSGFETDFERGVRVHETCAAVWCGRAPIGYERIFFVKVEDGQYSFTQSPCGGSDFEASQENEGVFQSCLRGRDCDE